MEATERKVIELRKRAGGVPGGIRTHLRPGRYQVSAYGADPYLQTLGSDPWGTATTTGLVVPVTATTSPQLRYLFQLARVSFNTPESAWLVGVRQYASLFGFDEAGNLFEKPITTPLWRFNFGGGNISWHVQVLTKTWRDTRNPSNVDSQYFLDAPPGGSALLYQASPLLGPYAPPNAGRPWGRPIASDLANMHDIRWPWSTPQAERGLNIPIPSPCDVVFYASVWQHNAADTPTFTANQLTAANPEDQFWFSYSAVQYGRVAGALVIAQELGKSVEDGDYCEPCEWQSAAGSEPR